MSTTVSSATSSTTTGTSTAKGINDMTSSDFIKVMLTQLQQQDPLNPSNSDQLLTQLSQIQQLQSSTNLNTTLQGLSLQQSIASGANLIGKGVAGKAADGSDVAGYVTSARVENGQVLLELNTNVELPLSSVTQIVSPATVAATGT